MSIELKRAQEEIVNLKCEAVTYKKNIGDNEKLMKDYIDMCELAIKNFGNSNTMIADQSNSEKLELAKASVGIQFKQFNELKFAQDELNKKLRDSELSGEMKDSQLEKLKIQISNQEKIVENNEKDMESMENKMSEMKSQADAQNNVIAKLMVDNNNSSTDPTASTSDASCTQCVEMKKVNTELEERCKSLRAMNEEVMGMLESMNGVETSSSE